MDEIKNNSDPIGRAIVSEEINNFIEAMKALWDSTKTNVPWWKFWKKVNFNGVINFLIGTVDQLVSFVAQLSIPGPDKKATVLSAVGKIYDYIIKEIMPFWLKPFSGRIRAFIIDVVLSNAIDWIVAKHNAAEFVPVPKEQLAAQWFTMKVNLTSK